MNYNLLDGSNAIGELFGVVIAIYLIIVLIFFVFLTIIAIGLWKIFKKAGIPGWHSLIPFVNIYDLFCLSWNKTAAIIALSMSGIIACIRIYLYSNISQHPDLSFSDDKLFDLIGDINIFIIFCLLIMYVICMYKLSESFGYDVIFTIGLLMFPFVFYCVLGFGSSQYRQAVPAQTTGYPYQGANEPQNAYPYQVVNAPQNDNPFSSNEYYSTEQNPFDNKN